MRFARFLTLALLSVAIVAGCTDASAGWTYLPAPSVTPPPSGAASAEPSGPAGSANPNVVVISALNIKFEQTTRDRPGRHAVPGPVREQGSGRPAQRGAPPRATSNGAELFKGEIFNGVATRVYDVPALDAGAYAFVCTVHPTMVGTLNVE